MEAERQQWEAEGISEEVTARALAIMDSSRKTYDSRWTCNASW